MAAPTQEELQLLPKFRQNLKDLNLQGFINSDLGLLQWLRARDLNLMKAEEMLRKSLKWRQENQIDLILSWTPSSEFLELCPMEFCGYDKENSPICFIPYGRWDLKKIYTSGYRDSYLKYNSQRFEILLEKMKGKVTPSGQPVTQFVNILDVEGLSMKSLASYSAMNMAMEAAQNFEANHPETMKQCIVLNAARVFSAFFSLVKPILSQRTAGKIQILDYRPEMWKKILLELVDENQLPTKIVDKWKNVDSNSPNMEDEKDYSNYKTVKVAAGETIEIKFQVPTPKSIINWAFFTENFDIGFSLVESKPGGSRIVVAHGKVNSHEEEQEGIVVCEEAATFNFVFDNTYSQLREKIVKYRITHHSTQ